MGEKEQLGQIENKWQDDIFKPSHIDNHTI